MVEQPLGANAFVLAHGITQEIIECRQAETVPEADLAIRAPLVELAHSLALSPQQLVPVERRGQRLAHDRDVIERLHVEGIGPGGDYILTLAGES